MGDEAVEGSKMGSKLIFFVAILALALVAFIVGKGLVNTGVDGLETSVQAINDSRFSDYNGKIVRGRAVKSALENFSNEEVAIVICTLSCADANGTLTASTLAGYDDKAVEVKIKNGKMKNSSGINVSEPVGICYNAQLDNGVEGNSQLATVEMSNGEALFEKDFKHDAAGNIEYNMSTGNITKKGTGEYISDNASFNVNLIKNSTGDICGILFIQRKLN